MPLKLNNNSNTYLYMNLQACLNTILNRIRLMPDSILIAFVWFVFLRKYSLIGAFKKIFDKKIFFSKSAKSDYKVFLINQLIMMTVSPFLITQLAIATALYFYFHTLTY